MLKHFASVASIVNVQIADIAGNARTKDSGWVALVFSE
jgi:hypothetical protein